MRLSELLTALGDNMLERRLAAVDPEIRGLAYDSRKVLPGEVFTAIPGIKEDGHAYLGQAVANGAAALIYQQGEAPVPEDLPAVRVKDSRVALAALSAAFYQHPDQRLRLIGVTGTNGKTTTTMLIKWLLEQAGHKTGLVGTVCHMAGETVLPSSHTTPESLELFRLFSLMAEQGCTYAVMEVSSHALSQGRVSACNFCGAVFTNLTQDHLDYHGSFEHYLMAKVKLFQMLDTKAGPNRYGVINVNDKSSPIFAQHCAAPLLTYGSDEDGSALRLLHYHPTLDGNSFSLIYNGRLYQVNIPLLGKFNVYNTLAAMAVALAEGIPMDGIIAALKTAPQAPGRFELIDEGQDFNVVVDYAHTPDGLQNVLSAAKKLHPRRLITVFGCGGNRDKGKRPIMGRIAGSVSDVAIITSDNPRFEAPLDIIDQIEQGIRQVCHNYLVEEDRAQAIRLALNMAESGDMVVIAGKGHEDYQIIGETRQHFDDREIVRQLLREKLGQSRD